MKLILIRHGETEENYAKIIQGHRDGKLTPSGIEQARKVALRLRNEQIDVIYCSDLSRARITAEHIAAFHGIFVISSSELRERKCGELEGRKRSEFDFSLETTKQLFINPPGGESREALVKRARTVLDKLLQQHQSKTVLLVSHAGMIKALLWSLLAEKPRQFFDGRIDNASITVVDEASIDNSKISLFNCLKHLE